MNFSTSFGNWLKQQRKIHDWTQAQLAEMVGCSAALIRKYEAEERRPSKQIAAIFADLFNIPTGERDGFLAYVRGAEHPSPLLHSNLPPDQTLFIGRKAELELLRFRLTLPECRLLVLTGLGGIGKTRLAIKASGDMQPLFPDGVFFISLLGVDSHDYLVSSLASVVGLAFHGPAELKTQLLHHLHARKLLLLIDNYEHLLPHTDLITEILDAAPNVKIMITSRERLKVQEEWNFPVNGLPYPTQNASDFTDFDTVQLFEQRAAQADSHIRLTEEDQPFVARICELVQGNPLAIELAAAWTRMLSCKEIAEAIQSNLDFLAKESHNAPERHQGMSAVFEYSWKRLSQVERTGFMKLSVFRGGFTQEAMLHVADMRLPVLASLLDKSFLARSVNGRYEIHELLRRYGETKLNDLPDELAHTQTALMAYYGTLLDTLSVDMWTVRHKQAITQIKGEIDNIRHAWMLAHQCANWEFFLKSVESIWHYYNDTNLFEEGNAFHQQTIAQLSSQVRESVHEIILAMLYHSPASFEWHLGNLAEAKAMVDKSLALLHSSGLHDYRRELIILGSAFQIAIALHDHIAAKYYVDECIAIGEKSKDPFAMAAGHHFGGILYRATGDLASAKTHFLAAQRFSEVTSSQRTLPYLLIELAQVEFAEQNLNVAKPLIERSIDLFSSHDDVGNAATAILLLGRLQLEIGDKPRAVSSFYEALRKSYTIHLLPLAINALTEIVVMLADAAEWASAQAILHVIQSHPAITQEALARLESVPSRMSEFHVPNFVVDIATTDGLQYAITVALKAETIFH